MQQRISVIRCLELPEDTTNVDLLQFFAKYIAASKLILEQKYSLQSRQRLSSSKMLKKVNRLAQDQRHLSRLCTCSPNPILVAALQEYYKEKSAKTIVDIGCGQCTLIGILKDQGYDVLGVDSNPTPINPIYIQQRDLSRPLNLGRTFDYVHSFEVGQHVYSQFQDNFIGNVARHAKHGIVMSWARAASKISMKERMNTPSKRWNKMGFKYNHVVPMNYKPKFDNWLRNTLMIFDKV